MDGASIERFADAFGALAPQPNGGPSLSYGTVNSVNADGSVQVRIGANIGDTKAARLCECAAGDRVLVAVMQGQCAAIGRVGGLEGLLTHDGQVCVQENGAGIGEYDADGTYRGAAMDINPTTHGLTFGYGSYAENHPTTLYGKPVKVTTDRGTGNLHAMWKTLWTGGYYMVATHTVNLSENISDQTHGIVLCWSAYSGGEVKDYDWVFTFIPKWHVSAHSGTGVISTGATVGGAAFMCKYVYVYNDHIVGHADNSAHDSSAMSGTNIKRYNSYWVLRAVLGV